MGVKQKSSQNQSKQPRVAVLGVEKLNEATNTSMTNPIAKRTPSTTQGKYSSHSIHFKHFQGSDFLISPAKFRQAARPAALVASIISKSLRCSHVAFVLRG